MDSSLKTSVFLLIITSNIWMRCSAISLCDQDFTIDSYALTLLNTSSKSMSDQISVLDFMSKSYYYWLQVVPEERIARGLPEDVLSIDAAFFIERFEDCSKSDVHLIGIVGNTYITYSVESQEWKTNQSLSGHKFLSKILAPITDDMKIDAITDWTPNRIIVFRDQTYRVIEWQNICDALNGKGLKIYPSVKTTDWFTSGQTDAAQMVVSDNESQNQSNLYLFSQRHFREMVVQKLDESNGQIIGQFENQKNFSEVFICVQNPNENIEYPLPEPAVHETQRPDTHTKRPIKESISPLPAIIVAIILLAIILLIISVFLPKESYIIAQKGAKTQQNP